MPRPLSSKPLGGPTEQSYMKAIINYYGRTVKSIGIKSIVLSLVVGLGLTGVSLRYIEFQMAPFSEEAGIITRGFPHPILKSGPFYAGYVGALAKEGGKEYFMNAPGAFTNPRIYAPGIIANIVFYIGLVITFSFLFNYRASLFSSASEAINKYGRLLGSARIFIIIIFWFFIFLLLLNSYAIFTYAVLGIDIVL